VGALKDVFGKIKNAVLTVAAAPSRAAFLSMVSLNVLKVAEKLRAVQLKSPANLQKWWQNLGGNYAKLLEVIDKGMTRRNVGQVGEAGTAAIITAAAPVIVALISLLKNEGISSYELEGAANAGINERAQDAALPYDEQALLDAQQYQAGENAVMSNNTKNIAIIGGAALLAYLLLKKK
jgi:hypothetical protein